jgi:hypothetical protein
MLVGQISATSLRHPGPQEGRFAVVMNVGPGCDGRGSARDERADAYGKIVWSWRPDAGVKSCGNTREATVARKPVTGESTI